MVVRMEQLDAHLHTSKPHHRARVVLVDDKMGGWSVAVGTPWCRVLIAVDQQCDHATLAERFDAYLRSDALRYQWHSCDGAGDA